MPDLIVPNSDTSFSGPVTPQAPAAPTPSPASAYLASTAQTAQSNIALAVGANPDYEAEMQRLAQQTGTPVDSVKAFPDAVKQRAAVSSIDFQNLAKQFPTTAAFYQSQNNAKIAHDDVPGMQAVEQATANLGPAGNTVPLAPGTTGYFQPDNSPLPLRERLLNWGRNLLGMGDAVPTGNAQDAGSAQAFIQNYARQNGMTVGQERDAVGGASEIPTQFAQGFENAFTAGLAPDASGPAQTTAGQVASGAGNLAGFVAGAPLKLAAGAVEKIGGSLLEHVAGESFVKAAAKDVVGQASTLGLASAITATGDALNQNSPEAALTTLGMQGLHGAEMGAVFGAAGRVLPDATIAQTLARVAGVNVAMDAIQGTTPWDDRSTAQKVMDYGLNSVFSLHGAGRATGAWMTDAAKADVAMGDAQTLSDLATSAANSKLRPRDPQAFKDFVATANADGPVQNIYVDGATLANALNQSGVKIGDVESTMPRVAQQLPEALATGGDVSIPVEDFATHIAGGPLGDSLMPHLKTDPDGMTQQQAQEFYQSSRDTFQQASDASAADKANDDTVAQSAQAVHDNILGQLTEANRFRPDVNKVYAALVRDSYTAAGARAGLSPESMFERYPLQITAEDASGANALTQEARGKLSFADDITSAPSTITLNKDADLSTFVHELGHFHLEMLSHMAKDSSLPEVSKDFETATNWMGTTPDAWRTMPLEEKRPMHEQFARGFEAYLMEGKAPTPELQGVFQRVRAWMVNVYKSLQNLHVQLSPEVRGVFDRMLASNDAIRAAEAERAYAPMFHSAEEAGMTPEEFQAYHALGNEATLEASDELTARTLRDMRFTEIAKDRASKEVRDDVAAKRAAVREQVKTDVATEPVYAAQDFMLGQANKENQIPADLVAERFGFANADEMTKAIADAEPRKQVIEALTDQRMLEKYGDITSPQAMNTAANQAIHNEVRTRFIATEYKALTKATGGVRVLEKAAKAVAETTIAKARVRDINASKYGAAEARAAKAADAARVKGDLTEAAQQKRNQLLNNQLEKTARAAATEVLKSLDYLKKFNKDSVRGKIDVDVRDQIDDMLSRFDLRKNPTDAPTRQQINLEKWVESQTALGMAPNVSPDMLNPTFRTPYRDMTMEQFRGLTDAVKSLEKIGRDRKTVTINGEKVEIASYVMEHLIPKMQARGEQFSDAEIFDKPADRSNNPFKIALDHMTSQLRSIKAQLKPQEYKRNQYDMHELLGPFGESIYEPVFRANYHEVDMLKGMSDDFQKMADHLGREWQDSLKDGVPNTRLGDVNSTTGEPLRINRGRMLGIALHVGNESNFDKLTSGWKWNPQDVWRFLHDNMSEKDWKAVQSVWDQYDKHWPDMVAMNQRLGNTSPERIEPRAFQTKFGEQRGGYAAIKYDPLRSRRGQIESAGRAIDPGEGLFGKSYYRPDTTTNGSLNARSHGYTDVVDLDFHTIPQAMTESIHDLAYRETLIDVHKIITDGSFRRQFQKTYGPEAYRSLQEWLGKTANADNQDREIGALGKILQYTRTGLVINGIAFRISTVLKHGGSAAIKTGGYFTGGGEKFLASRFAAMGTNYAAEIRGAQEKFPEIRARLLQQDRDFRAMSANLFEPESKISKAERFGHAAVAWSDMMTAVPTAWAAYDRAVTVGVPKNMGGTGAPMTEEQAVAYANKVVREAHGSNITTARSMVINNSSEAVKMFTTLYGFMNNSYGQAADIADKLKTAGISNPQTLARGFMALIVPAIWAGYLTEGPPSDKDGWAHWIAKSIGTEVAGMVPFVRDAAAMVEGYSHAGQVGVESFLNTMVGAGKDVYHMATGQHANAPIKDIANAAGMGLHIPGLGQLGGSAQYLADVANGKQRPQGPLDVAEGVALGRAPKH
ncbi:hypothetical protein [Paraburkholderia sp. BL21I4N1]|uniref:hypothetical protein n=1 Tax=Paraburkholderia sp. BL21I4N1 TaxID=1938801 RepID=UPI000CFC9935|nr:hypothetical protein [Paraburkholderia sp. BL21I4N1]PQV51870.1 hypothetical protein B0G83_10479 [Paraburkholderia sp. BL21I4N1]